MPANWTPIFTAEGSSGNGYIADLYIGTAAGIRITQVSYDDDPLLRTSQVIPPGHTSSYAINTSRHYPDAEGAMRIRRATRLRPLAYARLTQFR